MAPDPRTSRTFDTILALVALALVLIVVFLLETWVRQMQVYGPRTFPVVLGLWVFTASSFLFAAGVLFLFWLVNIRQSRNTVTSAIYIIIGLILLLSVPAGYYFLGGIEFIRPILLSPAFATLRNGFPLVGAFLVLTGLYGLFARSRPPA